MGHLRESFPILENLATGAGETPHSAIAGETAAGKTGLIGFGFRDSAGNLVLPQLTSEGKIAVDLEGAGVAKQAASAAPVAGANTLTLIAEIPLTAGKTYGKIKAMASCLREMEVQVIQLDDVTSTVIGWALTGPGHYNGAIDLGLAEIVAGATGTQKLQIKAKNLDKLSDMLGQISCLEFAG